MIAQQMMFYRHSKKCLRKALQTAFLSYPSRIWLEKEVQKKTDFFNRSNN